MKRLLTVLLASALVVLAGCGGAKTESLKVGASPTPHGEILTYVKEHLAAEAGLELEIIEFTDYVQPNLALGDQQLDANFFQHVPYMEDFAAEHNLDLMALAAIHIEPMGIYSSKLSALSELQEGAIVAIPGDVTNGGRALQLLAAEGLLTLKEGVGFQATVQDIIENPKNLSIKELEAAQVPRSLEDADLAVINGNYALSAGLNPGTDALALESGEGNPYANVLAVLGSRKDEAKLKKLAELLTSAEVKQFLETQYEGSIVPAF